MNEAKSNEMPRALILLGALLAIGLMVAAFILGAQTKTIGANRASISVKGLAEKQVKADLAEWRISAQATGKTFAEALANLRKEKVLVDQFLDGQGFKADSRHDEPEGVEPRFVEKEVNQQVLRVQEGYSASQTVVVTTKSLELIANANKASLDFKASGHDIEFGRPSYLVTNLEDVKISLISAATENAKKRAGEFIRHGDSQLGNMKSASQGAFYILPNTADVRTDEYGGTYDKTTVDKIARVVVTVEFNLK